jgi:hypothetical protein
VDCDKRTGLKEIKVGAIPKRLLEVHPLASRAVN